MSQGYFVLKPTPAEFARANPSPAFAMHPRQRGILDNAQGPAATNALSLAA